MLTYGKWVNIGNWKGKTQNTNLLTTKLILLIKLIAFVIKSIKNDHLPIFSLLNIQHPKSALKTLAINLLSS